MQREIQEFEETVVNQKQSLERSERTMARLQTTIKDKRDMISKLLVLLGELESKHKNHVALIGKCDSQLLELCLECGIANVDSSRVKESSDDLITEMDVFLSSKRKEIDDTKVPVSINAWIVCNLLYVFLIIMSCRKFMKNGIRNYKMMLTSCETRSQSCSRRRN